MRTETASMTALSIPTSGKTPNHRIQIMDLEQREAPVGIGRIHPILPVLRAGSTALVLNVIDLGQERRHAIARVSKRDPARVRLGAIQDVENRIALRPSESIEYFCNSVAVIDD